MASTIKTYPVSSLLLDIENPRFADSADNQRAAINELLDMASSKLVNLATDIVEIGDVNPSELPIVVEEGGDVIVLEGNRRIAALKLLAHPELADLEEHKRTFRDLALGPNAKWPQNLPCAMLGSREEARHWLKLRHTGENDGRGVVQWDALQSRNFDRRPGNQADRAALFGEAVKEQFPNETELLEQVATVVRERLTTLGRLVSDPNARKLIGYEFQDDKAVFTRDGADILPLVRKIFADMADDLGVSRIKTKKQREDYIRKLPARALNSQTHPTDIPPGHASASHPTSPRRRLYQAERVIFQGLKLKYTHSRTSKFLEQAQKIDIVGTPAIAAVLLRIVLELVVTEFTEKFQLGKESDPLKKKIRVALLALDPKCEYPPQRDKTLEAAWIRSQDEGIAVQSMNAFVHNFHVDPTVGEVRAWSDTFRKMLERLDDELGGLVGP